MTALPKRQQNRIQREQRILDSGHDQLSTWGLLKDEGKRAVRDWIEQLTGQGFLERAGDDAKFQVLKVTTAGRRLLRGEVAPRLLKPQVKEKREARVSTVSWSAARTSRWRKAR